MGESLDVLIHVAKCYMQFSITILLSVLYLCCRLFSIQLSDFLFGIGQPSICYVFSCFDMVNYLFTLFPFYYLRCCQNY